MRSSTRVLGITAIVAGTALAVGSVQAAVIRPVLEYQFNEGSSNQANSTGTDTTAAEIKGVSDKTNFWKTASPSGLSGDNSGNFGYNYYMRAIHLADNDNVDALTKFTLTGWYTNEGTGPVGQVLYNLSGSAGFKLQFRTNNQILLGVDGSEANTGTAYPDTNTGGSGVSTTNWVFFAATYDGTSTSNNVQFYKGDNYSSGSAAEVATFGSALTINKGQASDETQVLIVGKNVDTGTGFNFEGYLDDVRSACPTPDGVQAPWTPKNLKILPLGAANRWITIEYSETRNWLVGRAA